MLLASRERETVSSAVAALSSDKEIDEALQPVALTDIEVEADGEESGEAEETEGLRQAGALNRRLQNSHVTTVKTLGVPPYEVWERKLAARLSQWYEEMPYERRVEDPARVCFHRGWC